MQNATIKNEIKHYSYSSYETVLPVNISNINKKKSMKQGKAGKF